MDDKKQLVELTEDELKNINGGMVCYAEGLPEYDPNFPWEVVDNNNCRVLGKCASRHGQARVFQPTTTTSTFRKTLSKNVPTALNILQQIPKVRDFTAIIKT